MGQWRGKYLDTGPPRGPGHYSKDGRWWWEYGRGDLSATRPSLADVAAQGAWLETQRERFQELHQQLLVEGWRPAGRGHGQQTEQRGQCRDDIPGVAGGSRSRDRPSTSSGDQHLLGTSAPTACQASLFLGSWPCVYGARSRSRPGTVRCL